MAGTATAAMTESASSSNAEIWAHALLLTCKLTVELALPAFTVADVMGLQQGTVIPAHWRVGVDVPLRVNGTLLAHGEFEVAGEQLAIRLTELA
jgi:flagellar motor switch/type III secretory pathway protein FliN